MKKLTLDGAVDRFIERANAFDVASTLALFSADAVIEDVSVGEVFIGTDGIRRYLAQYFVGYHTTTTLLALERKDDFTASARVDFTGDFGHEIGWLRIRLGADGLIARIDANLD